MSRLRNVHLGVQAHDRGAAFTARWPVTTAVTPDFVFPSAAGRASPSRWHSFKDSCTGMDGCAARHDGRGTLHPSMVGAPRRGGSDVLAVGKGPSHVVSPKGQTGRIAFRRTSPPARRRSCRRRPPSAVPCSGPTLAQPAGESVAEVCRSVPPLERAGDFSGRVGYAPCPAASSAGMTGPEFAIAPSRLIVPDRTVSADKAVGEKFDRFKAFAASDAVRRNPPATNPRVQIGYNYG